MSKSKKKVVKDRFEKKKMIAFKNKHKKIIEDYDEDTETEEILLPKVQQENTTNETL